MSDRLSEPDSIVAPELEGVASKGYRPCPPGDIKYETTEWKSSFAGPAPMPMVSEGPGTGESGQVIFYRSDGLWAGPVLPEQDQPVQGRSESYNEPPVFYTKPASMDVGLASAPPANVWSRLAEANMGDTTIDQAVAAVKSEGVDSLGSVPVGRDVEVSASEYLDVDENIE